MRKYSYKGPVKGLTAAINKAMVKYQIRAKIYFPCQDGYDYNDEEADGEIYETYEEAKATMRAYKVTLRPNVKLYIEEVEKVEI